VLTWVLAAIAVLLGLGLGWLNTREVVAASRSGVDKWEGPPCRSTLAEMLLWIIGWLLMAVALIMVPPGDVLLFEVLAILALVCMCGGIALRGIWTLLHSDHDRRHHRQSAGDS
jgi:hypothetical protein